MSLIPNSLVLMGMFTNRIYFMRGLFSIYELIIISLICVVVTFFDQSLWDSELCDEGRVGRAFLNTSVLY